MITVIFKARYCYWHQSFTMNIHVWHSRDQWDIQLPLFVNYARIMKTLFSLFFVSLKVQWSLCWTNTFILVVVFQASYAISGFMTLNILNNYLGHETMVDSFISQRLPARQSSHDDSTQGMSLTYIWLRQVLFALNSKTLVKVLPDLPPNYDELFKNETNPIEKLNDPPEYVTTAAK